MYMYIDIFGRDGREGAKIVSTPTLEHKPFLEIPEPLPIAEQHWDGVRGCAIWRCHKHLLESIVRGT